ncbi:unnamed protein product [Menidia menidia]|uniref:(Atlantic silverside) hypothetical protein n=1 Tax=Menidia menidia TaxID=238744 RepID=A0A8S4B2U4_9TELE|nr:unnamed protein product [Menidia menidia]
MAELLPSGLRRCSYFFLYDGSKVRGEGDLTREGICYFYPEETPLDKQELLCGQLAGVGRCVSELSSSPVRTLRLRRCKFAIRMKEDFFWVDPLLLLKAALILQACQRCPLALAGCILFKGRIVSTQMSPELTMKIVVHESETYSKRSGGPSTVTPPGCAVGSTGVFLTTSELQFLQSAPVDRGFSSSSTPLKDASPKRTRLSRTLSDTPSTESEASYPGSSQSPQKLSFSPHFSESDNSAFSPTPSQNAGGSLSPSPPPPPGPPLTNGTGSPLEDSYYHSFHSNASGGSLLPSEDSSVFEENPRPNGGTVLDYRGAGSGNDQARDDKMEVGGGGACCPGAKGHGAETRPPPPLPCAFDSSEESPLIPMTLYMHRVNSLVLALLVEPHFMSDTVSKEEVYHSSLASLNGLEAHLRNISRGAPAAPGPYTFAHFDCIQSTLTTNVSGRPGGAPEQPFVRATSLLHSHFCNTETLQEAIMRNASAAVYGTRSVAQETYFQQLGGSLRNSGIPNHQDSAFSLPSKARHRLLKHGVNLL